MYNVNAHGILPGVAYQDSNVKVTAFLVTHGEVSGHSGTGSKPPSAALSFPVMPLRAKPSLISAMAAMCCGHDLDVC